MTLWYVFMCGMFFNDFLVCSCVVCFSVVFTCVHVWICVVCVFQWFSCACSCVVCFSVVFRRPKKKHISLLGGGRQICYKYVPSTCYIFLPPHHPKKKKANDASDGGGSNLLNIRPQHLLFLPPPPRNVSNSYCDYGIYWKNVIVTYNFHPPPLSGH